MAKIIYAQFSGNTLKVIESCNENLKAFIELNLIKLKELSDGVAEIICQKIINRLDSLFEK